MPAAPKGAKWVEPPRVVTRLNYRRDRQGFVDDGYPTALRRSRRRRHGAPDHDRRMGSTAQPEWTPDGKSLVFSSLRTENAEYAWRESEIYAVDVATGQVRQLTNRKGPDGNPTRVADGSSSRTPATTRPTRRIRTRSCT